ncbi:MAG: hypothetical protein UR23_C0005G0005 [Candidatus Roizmanbacteria bacterium GW2011_GWA2_32_13]|uniref:HIT domain-containing protein n=1 Tax=Candidatus Roizmanbacteria bacterium GW2011_GWA2_32_13 TaxID=1618475 RepID=A0A0G0BEF6_9BACT|nr:MAG: hypothetical protein UR23_C0005G0005 [Candidatus Roizmanbacteria bacterium GW2011_GWA2_32_13]
MDCIFCKVITRETSTKWIIEENDDLIVIEDINPSEPTDWLVVSKKHIVSVNEIENDDKELIWKMLLKAKELAKKYDLVGSGYKLLINVGKGAGQIIDHLHIHILSKLKVKNSQRF